MHSIHYNQLNDIEQLTYNLDYMTAMKKNDLPSIKKLTQLGTPIAFDHGASCSSLYQMFSYQNSLQIDQSSEILIYIFEHGIHHPEVEEVEQNIILTYAFDHHYFNLIDYFIEHVDFNAFTQYNILANCIGALLVLKESGTSSYYDKWVEKNYPIVLDECEDLNYLWQQRYSHLFNQQLALHTDHIEKFINNFGALSKLKDGFLNLAASNDVNIMAQFLLETINHLPQEKWHNIIASLDDRINNNSNDLAAKTIKSVITYQYYSNTMSGNTSLQLKKKI